MTPPPALLKWYDEHARVLPWRSARPDPYHVLLSEFMLQQTTVTTVKDYFAKFTTKWPTLADLARADDEDVMRAWAGLGYYARARNLLKAVREIDAQGAFPRESRALIKLAGVGPYTSAAIAAIAFDEAILPRDGNINRILARVFAIDDAINRPSHKLAEAANGWAHPTRAGDMAQALMDLGATVCRPKNPKCEVCPLASDCLAYQTDRTGELPVKARAKAKRVAFAHCYILENNAGAIGYVRRGEKELLGGMLALPTSAWEESLPAFDPPANADWIEVGQVRHIFTHIDLTLNVWRGTGIADLTFLNNNELSRTELPRLWAKALEKANNTKHSDADDNS